MTSIEWTDETWNPVRGCTRISPGCQNCYAELMTARFSGPGLYGHGFAKRSAAGPRWTGRVELIESKLQEPLRWRKPRRVFVSSMSDLWHESLSLDRIVRVYEVMKTADRHTFQVLTKRPGRRRKWLGAFAGGSQAPNVWEGTSVESPDYKGRIDDLRYTPAAVKFLSCEPLLGPLGAVDLSGIDWVIIGGESGPGARPMHPEWVDDIVTQCRAQGVAVFVKQAGAVLGRVLGCKDNKGGDMSAWPPDWRIREFPRSPAHLGAPA